MTPGEGERERGREGETRAERKPSEFSPSPSLPLSPSQRLLRWLVILISVSIFVTQWLRAGLRVEDGDFYLHWQFARRFVHHQLLYAEGLHIPYPPFWATAWSPIAALPLGAAKIACYPLSLIALAAVLWVLDRLTRDRLPLSSARRFWAAAAALGLASRFLVRELPECGPNLMLLALSWSAVYLWRRHRDIAAGVCLGFATALKCTPALLIAYFAWKRQWKLTAASIAAAGAFALAPALWQGTADYERHVRLWLTHLSLGAGQADPTVGVLGPETLQNLSLRPALARGLMHLPAGHPSRLDHWAYIEFLDFSPIASGRMVKLALAALVAAVAWVLRRPIARRDDLTVVWECAAVGALALLLSPITWYQHCVALTPVFYLLARTAAVRGRPPHWMSAVVAMFLLAVIVLSRGVIGREATLLLASYHLTTWAIFGVLLLALGGSAWRGGEGGSGRVGARQSPPLPLAPFLFRSPSWTGAFVVLGLLLRLYHYLRNPSLWHDEAALVINVLDKGFAELLGPLQFSEAAPPLFLWLEKCASLALGESLFALRLLPFVASCAALVMFAPVARRMLPPAAAPWAVLLFAVSDRLLWHACEAKQYSIEALASVLLLAAWSLTSGWPAWRRAACLTLLAPPTLCVAYPAAFFYGGLLVALLLEMRRSRRAGDWLAYGLLCLTVFATFGWLLTGPIRAQRDETIVTCWDAMSQFPDWTHPAGVPGWMLRSTCDLVGYCIKPVGQWLTPLAALGLTLLWRQGKRDSCIVLVVPILLALAASCVKAYPYGGMRVMAYAAPAVCLLVAAAVPWCLRRLYSTQSEMRRRAAEGRRQSRREYYRTADADRSPVASGGRQPSRGAAAVHIPLSTACIISMASRYALAAPLLALLAIPAVRAAYCAVRPWERADCGAAAAYVSERRRSDEVVTANHWEYLYYFRRLGRDFRPLESLDFPARGRMWVLVTGAAPADRQPCLAAFAAPGWVTKERREFERTTVLLVERGQSGASSSPGPLARRP